MTKQVFELISDATVLSDIHSLGAVIIRLKDSGQPTYITSYKCLFIYKAGDSSQAELLAGLYGIKHLISANPLEKIDFDNSRWVMDLPHISSIVKKQRQIENLPDNFKEILDLLSRDSFEIKLPNSKNKTEKHHLCHRMCRLGRNFYTNPNNLEDFFSNFTKHLNKINSKWALSIRD